LGTISIGYHKHENNQIKNMGFPKLDENKGGPNFPDPNCETNKEEQEHNKCETRI